MNMTREAGAVLDRTASRAVRVSPFRGDHLLSKVAPFAVAAFLAEASLVLPPGVSSGPAGLTSLVLLIGTVICIPLVPWDHLPRQAAVVVPLLYCGSALALLLAAGANSGIGIVVLIPLIWTALFHDRWESAIVVVAILLIELSTSMAQHSLDATIARRLVLWGLIGTAIASAVHGLRTRITEEHHAATQLRDQLREAELTDERLRIALRVHEQLGSRVFATTITLAKATQFDADRKVRDLVSKAVTELDETLALLRTSIFEQPAAGETLTSQVSRAPLAEGSEAGRLAH